MDLGWIILILVVYLVGLVVALWLAWDDIIDAPIVTSGFVNNEPDAGPGEVILLAIIWPIALAFLILMLVVIGIGALSETGRKSSRR